MNNIRLVVFCLIGLIGAITLASCGQDGPQAIRYGQEQCVYCKMTISDPRFGTQIMSTKGKAYNFDDIQCMIAFVKAGDIEEIDIAEFYLPDYSNEHTLLPAKDLFYLKSESLKSPMRGDIAAFSTMEDLEEVRQVHGGEVLNWEELWR